MGAVVATADSFRQVAGIRHLSDGSVLVNDPVARRLVLLDSTLALRTVVADSTSATATAYSGRIGGLITFRGDSTLFTDPQSLSMLVIDPAGKIARSLAVPRSRDAMQLIATAQGAPGYDPRGYLVYRAGLQFAPRMLAGAAAGGGGPMLPEFPDSQAIIRVNLATRVVDTVGMIKVVRPQVSVTESEGRMMMRAKIDPLPVVDDWVMLPDGTVGFVRGRDYRIEWVHADGTRESSPKIPFEWQRLSDEDKVAFIDSVKVARERIVAEAQAAAARGDPAAATAAMAVGAAIGGGPGGGGPLIALRGRDGGGPPPQGARQGAGERSAGPGPGQRGGFQMPQVEFVDPKDLPDYKPPFFAGAARADAEGNIWIRTIPTRAIPGGPVYDVINRNGELVDRVQVPEGRVVVGFGPGVVYVTSRKGAVTTLEKARVR
ncbi:MAG: hypothetical protein ACT4PM_08980 [Gemmatimonadales bacterium]